MSKGFQGIILAGGKSSRMGKNKAHLLSDDKSFILKSILLLKTLGIDVMVIGEPDEYPNLNVPVYPDLIKEKGPAGGIYTGLYQSKQKRNLIISCDMPQLESSLLKELMNNYKEEDALICISKNKLHPLVGIYHQNSLYQFRKSIEQDNLKLSKIIERLNFKTHEVLQEEMHQLLNINTMDEYKGYMNNISD